MQFKLFSYLDIGLISVNSFSLISIVYYSEEWKYHVNESFPNVLVFSC